MILWLGEVSGVAPADLLARRAKNGDPQVRGPLVDARADSNRQGSTVRPLSALRSGDKLHIVAPGDGSSAAGLGASALVQFLADLGFENKIQLKQIHLIVGDSGRGGATSFANRFLDALTASGFQATEIKAPLGRVRCDPKGKIWVFSEEANEWTPSGRHLNQYCSPA